MLALRGKLLDLLQRLHILSFEGFDLTLELALGLINHSLLLTGSFFRVDLRSFVSHFVSNWRFIEFL